MPTSTVVYVNKSLCEIKILGKLLNKWFLFLWPGIDFL